MKKIISIMLTIIMCASCLVPVAFAETESQKFAFTDFKTNNFEYTGINYEYGMFGKRPTVGDTRGELSYVADFLGERNGDKGLMATSSFAPSEGSSIRISTKFAVDTDSVKDGAHLSMGLLTVNKTTPDNAGTETRFNPIYGSVVAGTNNIGTTVPTSPTLYKTPVKTWVTYEMIYDIVDSDGTKYIDKQSLYVDGQPVYTDHSLLSVNGDAKIPASTIYGIYYGERKRVAKVHFADMSLTYYPGGFDESKIDANPWTASGLDSYFTPNTDGSYILTDLSLTDEIIAESAPEGWTFSHVSYNDATDGEIEYIRMDKDDTTYFKKIISQDYISVKNVNFTDATVTNSNSVYGGGLGMRYTGVSSQQNDTNSPLTSTVLTTNSKSADNDYINLSYKYLPNQLCGLAISNVPGSSSTYINGALTGRVAYEWSFMVDEFATNSIACRMYFNGTPGEKTITAYNRWIPFQVQNGYLRFNDDGTITKVREPQTVLPGEWHHFVLVADTNAKTLDIYQNGILIGTRQFTADDTFTINSVNGMDIGVNNSGLPQVDVAHSVNLDDVRIGYVSADWTPETLAVTSNDESVTVNDITSIIFGSVTSAEDVGAKLTVPADCTSVYSDGTVKVTDSTSLVIRYYKVADTDLALNGFDISTLTTDVGKKTLDVVVENNKEDVYNAVLILASYDTNGCLVDLDISKQANIYAKQVKTLTAEIDVTEEEPVKTFKAFLWENTDSITPLKPSLTK